MQAQLHNNPERLFLNSIPFEHSRASYKLYLHKYLELVGYSDLNQLLSRDHKEIEDEMIEFIIGAKEKGIDPYLQMRERYGEVILPSSPLIREQFDKRDPFAAAHPRHVKVITIAKKITELAEAAGLRTRMEKTKGTSPRKEVPNCNGFRRYHSSTLVNSGLKSEHRWLLEGHRLIRNDPSYVHVSNDDLLQSYLLAHDNLLIVQSHRLREKIQKLEVEKTRFERLAAKIASLEAKINA